MNHLLQFRILNRRLISLFCVIMIPLLAKQSSAQHLETFDSLNTTWQLSELDAEGVAESWKQQRRNAAKNPNRFEAIQFRALGGTRIRIAHDLPPAYIIPELDASIRIKATSPGIRMSLRIVFPYSPAPGGVGPLTAILGGTSYDTPGRWQTLSLKDNEKSITEKVQQQLWVLRREFGGNVSARDAYVDKIILDLYTGPGESEVQIDDLSLNGIVSAERTVKQVEKFGSAVIRDHQVQPAGFVDAVSEKRPSHVVRNGTILTVHKKPFFPRVIQHNGESFGYLKTLGFNTIELSGTATPEQLKEADETDMWVICPAPSSAGLETIGFDFDRVLAWSVGRRLGGNDFQNVQQLINEIRHSDLRDGRPVMANIESHWQLYSQYADVLAIGMEPLGTSFIASQYSDWIRQRRKSIGNGNPVWATVQTEISGEMSHQVRSIAKQVPPTPVEPQQMKVLAYEVIAGGARGMRFVSQNRLDTGDPVTKLRALSIRWLNGHIDKLEPWALGGANMGTIPTGNPELEVTAINTNESRLLLIQRPTHHEQHWAGDVMPQTVQFRDVASTFTNRAYRIGENGVTPLSSLRDHGGAEVNLENCTFAEAVVMTQDPAVIQRVSEDKTPIGEQSLMQMHTEITRQWLAILQLVDKQMGRMGQSNAATGSALNQAINAYRKAGDLINNNSPVSGLTFLDQADERLAFARRELLTSPLGMFKSKTSTPFLTHASLVPLHWQLSSQLRSLSWNPNGLPGGDFENLKHMSNHGWKNRRIRDARLNTKVVLDETAAREGQFGLRLSVSPTDQLNDEVLQTTPVWVTSAKVPVTEGQLVRIHGWVKIEKTISHNHDGLLITESLGGPQFAERIPVTQGWQEFTLYRGVKESGNMDVTFALTGVGTALIDEVTIRAIDLPEPTLRQARK